LWDSGPSASCTPHNLPAFLSLSLRYPLSCVYPSWG